ncbi:hypothetical protein [Rhodococcus sp. SJ-3]|uniref:hypothetical protein n=1 Tax=Rhodococcus sp. SJ-3 TaxID=3454628 RepID=UPI003F7ADD6A
MSTPSATSAHHRLITDIHLINSNTPDDALVNLHVAAEYVGHTVPYMRNMRADGRGPVSHLRARRIVYRLGDLRAYNDRYAQATTAGGNY